MAYSKAIEWFQAILKLSKCQLDTVKKKQKKTKKTNKQTNKKRKEKILKKSRAKYQNLSEEEKNKKWEYCREQKTKATWVKKNLLKNTKKISARSLNKVSAFLAIRLVGNAAILC